MFRAVVILITLYFSLSALKSQNRFYTVMYDSIYPLIDSNSYTKAKKIWQRVNKEESLVDPSEELIFLGFALQNHDIQLYKQSVVGLISYGWQYTYEDTLNEKLARSNLLQEIKRNELVDWTVAQSAHYFPKWKDKNLESLRFKQIVDSLIQEDQLSRYGLMQFSKTKRDSLENLIAVADFNNLKRIADLCEQNDSILLNNFDNGVGIYFKVSFIFWHNLKSPSNYQKAYDLLKPFAQKAYMQGKINGNFFKAYEKWKTHHLSVK